MNRCLSIVVSLFLRLLPAVSVAELKEVLPRPFRRRRRAAVEAGGSLGRQPAGEATP